jgi:hypothetical protein
MNSSQHKELLIQQFINDGFSRMHENEDWLSFYDPRAAERYLAIHRVCYGVQNGVPCKFKDKRVTRLGYHVWYAHKDGMKASSKDQKDQRDYWKQFAQCKLT